VPIDYSSIPKALALASVVGRDRARATTTTTAANATGNGTIIPALANSTNQSTSPLSMIRERFWYGAFVAATSNLGGNSTSNQNSEQVCSLKIWLRPGRYYLKHALTIRAAAGVTIAMETMTVPAGCPLMRSTMLPRTSLTPTPWEIVEQALPLSTTPNVTTTDADRSFKRGPSFRNLFRCHRNEAIPEETDVEETDFEEWDSGLLYHQQSAVAGYHPLGAAAVRNSTPKYATLVLRGKQHNEPAFLVSQGELRLSSLEISHSSPGHDIWNGNAAVQIQPPDRDDDNDDDYDGDGLQRPPSQRVEPRPMAILENVHVTSKSGRGIVTIDGGHLSLTKCAVTDCAATGVYVGGPGSTAMLKATDVLRNGVGNPTYRRGIARGHSGVYLEQGTATVRQSNVSYNTLTGISVVSPDNAILTLHDSTLVGNGTYQLELPPPGSASRRRCSLADNTMAVRGEAPSRSGLWASVLTNGVEPQGGPHRYTPAAMAALAPFIPH
jgi:hypothetical protein